MILAYADIQIGKTSLFDLQTESGYGLRLDNFVDCAIWIAKEINERKPQFVVNLGDTFNQIGLIDTDSLSATSLAISIIQQACEDVGAQHIILLGNHDYSYVSGKTSSIDIFDFLSEAIIVKDPKMLEFGPKKIGLLPYFADPLYNSEVLENFMANDVDMIFSHIDLNGFKSTNHMDSDYGIDPSKVTVPMYNGHHHIYQYKDFVRCPGSCIQHRYSEFTEKRGIIWLDNKLEETFIDNTVSPWLYKAKTFKELDELPDNTYVWFDHDCEDEDLVDRSLERFPRTIRTKAIESMSTIKTEIRIKGDDDKEILSEYIDKVLNTELDKKKLTNLALQMV